MSVRTSFMTFLSCTKQAACPPALASPKRAARRTMTVAAAALSSSQGCYMGDVHVQGAPAGPLAGLTAVVKDSYDIAGHRTSNGSPAWLDAHPPAAQTALAVQALLDAGVTVVGKTVMDELAYSLTGENVHYGTPINPACPDRCPGGSSAGSAAAVAAGDADIGLGGDTGGSVRVPASYCGIYGIRPTHGRVPVAGSAPLAPSFDTAGWFAQDASVLRRVGDVLLDPASRRPTQLRRWLVGTDAFGLADEAAAQAVYAPLAARIEAVSAVLGSPQEVEVGSVEGGLRSWFEVFRVHQAYEVWQTHGTWVSRENPTFGPGIKERFQMAAAITQQNFDAAAASRAAIRAHLAELLGPDGVLAVPTAPGPAPLLRAPADQADEYRGRLLSLTCIAGLTGFPQVNIPVGRVDGCPVGLGLVAPPGADEDLLELTERLASVLAAPGSS